MAGKMGKITDRGTHTHTHTHSLAAYVHRDVHAMWTHGRTSSTQIPAPIGQGYAKIAKTPSTGMHFNDPYHFARMNTSIESAPGDRARARAKQSAYTQVPHGSLHRYPYSRVPFCSNARTRFRSVETHLLGPVIPLAGRDVIKNRPREQRPRLTPNAYHCDAGHRATNNTLFCTTSAIARACFVTQRDH